MGGEFGQWSEWYHEASLDWHLLDEPRHAALQRWVEDLNRVYRQEPALFTQDFTLAGFQWIDCNDWEHSIITFLRQGRDGGAGAGGLQLHPGAPAHYRVGVPASGFWQEVLNSDAAGYRGQRPRQPGGPEATPIPCHGRPTLST